MKNVRMLRRQFMGWATGGQTLLLERARKGVVYALRDDGGPSEKACREAVEALDRGETLELTDVNGRVVTVVELTEDGYVERLAEGITEEELRRCGA